jgi:O-antigen/teichoic acid export membrane protein
LLQIRHDILPDGRSGLLAKLTMTVEDAQRSNVAGDGPNRHWRRLLHGVGANLLGKLWVVAGQFIAVPVLLSVWGPEGYGLWLMVSAVASYIALSDFGFGGASAVRMTQMVATNRLDEALRVFQSVSVLIGAIIALLLVASVGAVAALPLVAHLFGVAPPKPEVAYAFLILMVYAAVDIQMACVSNGFRATRRYAQGTVLYDIAFPLESLAVVVSAVLTRSIVVCATAQLAVRSVAFVLYYSRLRQGEPWIKLGWSHASWDVIRDLAKPSLANFAYPLAAALSIQGVVFTIGLAFGPAAAGVFGAVRTFTRLPLQLVAVITRASSPELTLAHALGNKPLIARLTALSLATTILIFGPFILASPWGAPLLHLITRGRVTVHPGLFVAMEVLAGIQATWATFAIFLYAENKLQKIVPFSLLSSLAAAVAPLIVHSSVTLTGIAALLAGMEFVVLLISARIWWRVSGLDPADFIGMIQSMPRLLSQRGKGVTAQESPP